jgi:hypothetical protein
VTDEYTVLSSRHTFAGKSMAGDIAISANFSPTLDFDKDANFGVISNFAAVEIDKIKNLYIGS